jgi:hypothetical protein
LRDVWIRTKAKGAAVKSRRATTLAVFRIRILMFLGLMDPDSLVRGMDPDPSIMKQKVRKTFKKYYAEKRFLKVNDENRRIRIH